MNSPLKAIAVVLLAGAMTGSITACSKDLPTGLADNPGVAASQPTGSVKVRPANDDFDNALVITALPFRHTVNTTDATTDHDDPLNDETCGFGSIGGHTVWYQFTPAENLRINTSTVGSDYDPNMFVYTGTRGDLTRVDCNSLPASMTFEALAGETYYILVGSQGEAPGGNLVFQVDESAEVSITIDPEGSVNPSTGAAVISGTVTCSQPAFVELSGSVQQRRATSENLFVAPSCDGETRWEAEVFPDNGRFVPGPAQVSVAGSFTADQTTEEGRVDRVSATVLLR